MENGHTTQTSELIAVGTLLDELRQQTRDQSRTQEQASGEIGKQVPHSLEAEKGLLCGIFLDSANLEEPDVESLTPEDFYHPNHATVFAAMQKVSHSGEPVNTTTVLQELLKLRRLEQVGGVHYLVQLEAQLPTSAHSASYARIIKDKSNLRRLIKTATQVLNSAYRQDRRTTDVIDEAERIILEIRDDSSFDACVSPKSLAWKTLEKIAMLNENPGRIGGISTGFQDFDQYTNGLQAGELIIVAARPSMGKTAFTLNIAAHVAIREKQPVAFFSLEMDAEQLMQRLIAAEAKENLSRMCRGEVKAELLTEPTAVIANAPLYIDPTSSLSIPEMRKKCRRLVHRHGVKLIIVDYLQLMTGPDGYDNKAAEVAEISRGLKSIAREFRVSVIALSQLNRGAESRPDKRPMMSDLRESGAIEQDADVVTLLYRDEYYLRDKTPQDQKGLAEVIVAKNRNGPTGGFQLKFFSEETRFANSEEDFPKPARPENNPRKQNTRRAYD
jgi:replicative DNA helicase